jgi:outer membrane immunogenic protein
MAVKAPLPPPAPVYSWTGFYFGLNAGWSWGKQDTTVNFPGPAVTSASGVFDSAGFSESCVGSGCSLAGPSIAYSESTRPTGAIGGVQIGYNWQVMSNWIFGIEADIQASGESASGNAHQSGPESIAHVGITKFVSVDASQSISQNGSLLWFGTPRGRIGYAVWPTVMLYGTGGLAYGRLNESVSASFNSSCTTNAPRALRPSVSRMVL